MAMLLSYEPILSLKHFMMVVGELETDGEKPRPVYSVLLYAAGGGVDGQLHTYMTSHAALMDGLTGPNWLLMAIEDIEGDFPKIIDFRPEDVYAIGRSLGVPPDALPCLTMFTNPLQSQNTVTLPLKEFFPESADLDEKLTDFFRSLASVIDRHAEAPDEERLMLVSEAILREWPLESEWLKEARDNGERGLRSVEVAGNVAKSLTAVLVLLGALFK